MTLKGRLTLHVCAACFLILVQLLLAECEKLSIVTETKQPNELANRDKLNSLLLWRPFASCLQLLLTSVRGSLFFI